MRVAPQVMLQLSLALAVHPANAQSRLAPLPDGPAPGGSVEVFRYEEEGALTAFSFHLSRLKHNGLGLELGMGMFPEYLQLPALVVTPDVGVGFNLSLPAITLLLRGGGSAIVALGGQGTGEFLAGGHLGGAVLLQVDRRAALRADLLRRWYLVGGETEPFWSFALGFSILPR